MLPPPSPSLGRSHSIIILLMVDRETDNWCRPSFALVFSPRRRLRVPCRRYVFLVGRCDGRGNSSSLPAPPPRMRRRYVFRVSSALLLIRIPEDSGQSARPRVLSDRLDVGHP